MPNYFPYHIHSWYSLLDSATDFRDYVDKAVELGQTAIAFTEHGNIYNWFEKKQYCESKGLKYVHGCEVYLTESLELTDDVGVEFKVRDNYHTILLAKNHDGFLELNSLISKASDDAHFHFKPRISFDEFLNISDNIIKISACLQSPLNLNNAKKVSDKLIALKTTDYGYYDNFLKYYDSLCKKYDYYEVQPHVNSEDQKGYNKYLLDLSNKYRKKLVCGTDTHSINQYKAECRSMLMLSKGITFKDDDTSSGENTFDLTYKSYDQLVEMFKNQGALDEYIYLEAIENTNLVEQSIEPIVIDTSIKYPKMYDNDEEYFVKKVYRMFNEKLADGTIPPEQKQQFEDNIKEELRVFKKTNMCGFMLSMSEIVCWCRENNIPVGFGRGSCCGSSVAYVTDIIDVNPVQWQTVFSRFCNEDRVEVGDIDSDYFEDDRPKVYDYIIKRFGQEKTGYVLAFGTWASLAAIDGIGKALDRKWIEQNYDKYLNREEERKYSEYYNRRSIKEQEFFDKSPYSLQRIKQIKEEFKQDEEKAKEKYKELFYYYDGLVNVPTSQSMHPAGIIASPITLADNIGEFTSRDGKVILQLDMDSCHDIGLTKYDILGLKNVGIIGKTAKYLQQSFPKSKDINWNDQKVWADMKKSPIGIFQFEGDYAFQMLCKFKTHSIEDMCLVTAAVRPGGASYRDQLMQKIIHKNPSPIIDKILEKSYGYLCFQEDTLKFLQQICGLSGSEADNVRRAIGHKDMNRLQKALPDILNGYCSHSDKPREDAEKEAKEFLQVIEDSASYQFGYNHSVAYSMLGYVCAYYRCYHPLEFLTAFFNCSKTEEDFANGASLAGLYKIKILPPKFRYSVMEYWMDKESNSIYKGIGSVKFMNQSCADDLYNLRDNHYDSFVDLLRDIYEKTSVNSRQLDILIKLDFFDEFGNAKELLRLVKMYDMFGTAKTLKKEKIANSDVVKAIVERHSIGVTKAGKESKSYTQLDNSAIMNECETLIMSLGIKPMTIKEKAEIQKEYMGYVDIATGKQEDRPKLYILDVKTLKSKASGKTWARQITAQSIGSGKQSNYTITSKNYHEEFQVGDIILCKHLEKQKDYWHITNYEVLVNI